MKGITIHWIDWAFLPHRLSELPRKSLEDFVCLKPSILRRMGRLSNRPGESYDEHGGLFVYLLQPVLGMKWLRFMVIRDEEAAFSITSVDSCELSRTYRKADEFRLSGVAVAVAI